MALALTDRYRKLAEEREALRRKLEADNSVSHGHPKAVLLFDLAWEFGHANGESEVGHFYREMAGLLDEPEEGKEGKDG